MNGSGRLFQQQTFHVGGVVVGGLFVAQGDKIEIDTRTGEYRRRV